METSSEILDCLNCDKKYYCCKKFGVTLNRDEISSGKFKNKTKVVPLTENNKILGYVMVLNKKENGSCVFHTNGLCEIYEYRPQACKNFSCIGHKI